MLGGPRQYGPDAISPEITQGHGLFERKVRLEFQAAAFPWKRSWLLWRAGPRNRQMGRAQGLRLVAMSTHGHRFLADIFLGETARRVQHSISVPVLLLRAK